MRDEKGQATVEMALCVTLLLLLVFGLIDFARIFHAQLTLDHAGREGARAASVGGTDQQIQDVISQASGSLGSTNLTVSITPTKTERRRGTYVTVDLAYSIPLTTPLLTPFLPNPYSFSKKTTMRME
ncbi:TadE/TadG family type IV pilus assembly protein [Ammoniphilus sp. 3BR4]|uniref:TadE/TadG family type IV pilus assembly protein n=1 Tax=Ammoniphilus sp. 3BR4 TaxID=3158265 RepID=UPI0034677AE8